MSKKGLLVNNLGLITDFFQQFPQDFKDKNFYFFSIAYATNVNDNVEVHMDEKNAIKTSLSSNKLNSVVKVPIFLKIQKNRIVAQNDLLTLEDNIHYLNECLKRQSNLFYFYINDHNKSKIEFKSLKSEQKFSNETIKQMIEMIISQQFKI